MSQGPLGVLLGQRPALGSFLLTHPLTQGDLKPPCTNAGLWLMSLAREVRSMGPFIHQVKHFNKTSAKSKVLTNDR